MKSNANQARELRSSLAPCSLLGFRDPTFFVMGTQVAATGRHRLRARTLEIHEISWNTNKTYENHLKSMKSIENR